MGFRFSKRVKILPGVALNFSKSGTSLSVGRRGATMNINKNRIKTTFSLLGTGVSYTQTQKIPHSSIDQRTSYRFDLSTQTYFSSAGIELDPFNVRGKSNAYAMLSDGFLLGIVPEDAYDPCQKQMNAMDSEEERKVYILNILNNCSEQKTQEPDQSYMGLLIAFAIIFAVILLTALFAKS